MERTKIIQVRVTPEQHSRIKNKAASKGYVSMSSFILHCVLERDLVFEQHFDEMYKAIVRKSRNAQLSSDLKSSSV